MKLFNYLLIAMIIISSCKEDDETTPVFYENYGEGMYIVTDKGVSFYNHSEWDYIYDSLSNVIDSTQVIAQVKNQIFKTVNNRTIINPKKIKFNGTKAYIIADNYILTANVKTFENKGEINGFLNPVDLDFISNDRIFVVDKDDSKVKEVDLVSLDITSQIETGESTRPVFIISNGSYAFVMNGGGDANQIKDSTVVLIEYRDNLEHLADSWGDLLVGDNPNSAIFSGNLRVLCKGIYDPINSLNNTESLLSKINKNTNEVYATDVLPGIFNAQNLTLDSTANLCYLTAEGGVYTLDPNSLITTHLPLDVNASVISIRFDNVASSQMLYMNDLDNPKTIYKYNLNLSSFTDTIIVDGNVRDINFY